MIRTYRYLLTMGLALAVALSGVAMLPPGISIAQQDQEGLPDVPMADEVARPGGSLPGDPSIQLVLVADGLVDPVNVSGVPDGSGRIFIVERTGTIRIVENGELVEEPFLDISSVVATAFLEQGLLGLAFHPDYANNGRFFVYYTAYRTNGDSYVTEFRVSDDNPNVANPESARVLLTHDQPYVNHNGGTIRFGPDGYLYIALGDGGLAGDPYRNAQDIDTMLGSILRIDVDTPTAMGDGGNQDGNQADAAGTGGASDPESYPQYGIPADNPFGGQVIYPPQANNEAQDGSYRPDARPEIWAYGLRNPWQFSFDPATGDLYIADVGQNQWEEIHFEPADSSGGVNYGWPYLEGAHCYILIGDTCQSFGELPVAEYDHSVGCSITGIGVHRGEESASLDGMYFTSDFCSGRIWGLARDEGDQWQFAELMDTDLLATGSGQDENGNLYLTACNCQFGRDYDPFANPNGTVWRIVAEDEVPEGAVTVDTYSPGDGDQQDGDDQDGDDQASGDQEDAEEVSESGATTGASTAMTQTGTMTETATGAATDTEARTIEVIARSMEFVPGTAEPIQVQQGEPVHFVVESPDIYHTFTVANSNMKEEILFNLDVFPGRDPEEITWTFEEAGTYYLYCIPHEGLGMVGTIEVVE